MTMTTEAQSADRGGVPRYFADFIQGNARRHAELGGRISRVEGELRVIKGVTVAIFIAVAAPALKYLIGL